MSESQHIAIHEAKFSANNMVLTPKILKRSPIQKLILLNIAWSLADTPKTWHLECKKTDSTRGIQNAASVRNID